MVASCLQAQRRCCSNDYPTDLTKCVLRQLENAQLNATPCKRKVKDMRRLDVLELMYGNGAPAYLHKQLSTMITDLVDLRLELKAR